MGEALTAELVGWAGLGALLGTGLLRLSSWIAGRLDGQCLRSASPDSAPLRSRARGLKVGLATAALAVILALVFLVIGLRAATWSARLVLGLYSAGLLLVALLDLRFRLVYGSLTYPLTLLAWPLGSLALNLPVWSSVAGALFGAAVFGALYALAGRLYRTAGALGLGDVMIAGLVGAMTGFPAILGALMLGTLAGGLAAAGLMITGRSRTSTFAYGPALCLGALLSLLSSSV